MTNCPTEAVLLDYISGSLSPTQAALFQRHAKDCARCGALASEQAAIWRSLDEWKPAPVSAGFNRELWRRIDAEAQSPSWTQTLASVLRAGLWKQVAPLAVAAALVVTGYVLDHRTHSVAVPATALVSASEAAQLERTLDDMQLLNAVNADPAAAKPGFNVM